VPALKLSEPEGDTRTRAEKEKAREERLAAIKRKVESGNYSVDPVELSKKIIGSHLSKKAGS
jgi:anti-sigma28 factor (negative regulator of flagellin synthesis)